MNFDFFFLFLFEQGLYSSSKNQESLTGYFQKNQPHTESTSSPQAQASAFPFGGLARAVLHVLHLIYLPSDAISVVDAHTQERHLFLPSFLAFSLLIFDDNDKNPTPKPKDDRAILATSPLQVNPHPNRKQKKKKKNIYIYMCIYIYITCVCVCMCVGACACMCVYIHIYIFLSLSLSMSGSTCLYIMLSSFKTGPKLLLLKAK